MHAIHRNGQLAYVATNESFNQDRPFGTANFRTPIFHRVSLIQIFPIYRKMTASRATHAHIQSAITYLISDLKTFVLPHERE